MFIGHRVLAAIKPSRVVDIFNTDSQITQRKYYRQIYVAMGYMENRSASVKKQLS